MIAYFMRYVSHRNHNMSLLQNHMFHISWDDEILHQNHHISWLHISWDISKDNCLRRSYGPRDTVSDPLLAHCVTTVSIIWIKQDFIVDMLLAQDLGYYYVQEYVIVEIFCLALWYFQYSVTGEQTAWCVFNNYLSVSASKIEHTYWWSQRGL